LFYLFTKGITKPRICVTTPIIQCWSAFASGASQLGIFHNVNLAQDFRNEITMNAQDLQSAIFALLNSAESNEAKFAALRGIASDGSSIISSRSGKGLQELPTEADLLRMVSQWPREWTATFKTFAANNWK
jgi:hypothetical protein